MKLMWRCGSGARKHHSAAVAVCSCNESKLNIYTQCFAMGFLLKLFVLQQLKPQNVITILNILGLGWLVSYLQTTPATAA